LLSISIVELSQPTAAGILEYVIRKIETNLIMGNIQYESQGGLVPGEPGNDQE
jgi:hypothetical protein